VAGMGFFYCAATTTALHLRSTTGRTQGKLTKSHDKSISNDQMRKCVNA
jgi:hypothetical protein